LGLTAGLQRSLASNGAVITLTIPVLMALLAALLLGERMTGLRWLAFALAIAGVLLTSDIDWRSVRILDGRYLLGNLLIFLSCAGSAFYNVFSKKLLDRFSAAEVVVYSFLVADAVLLAILVGWEPLSWAGLAALGPLTWINLALIGLFSLGLSMVLYFWVIQRIDVTQASLSVYLLPVFGVVLSTATLGERLRFELIAGGVLVFLGTFLVTVYEERAKSAASVKTVV
jgi:drug/metabolite transporter (DMT)-like permease